MATFRDIIDRVSLGVQRDDLTAYYPVFVNEGIKEIQKQRDWAWLKSLVQLTIPNGQDQIYLPDDFKSFADTPTAFLLVWSGNPLANTPPPGGSLRPWPCEVQHRSEFQRHNVRPGFYTLGRYFPLWYDIIGGRPTLGISSPAQGDIILELAYYRFLPELRSDDDSNYLLQNHVPMVIAQAKAIAFAAINDPVAVSFQQEAAHWLLQAQRDDDKNRFGGIKIRIGG